jgi:hypothetical protein
MPKINFRFAIILENYKLSYPHNHAGPLFHRWLPNGESDAIELNTDDQDISLKVWFVRRGFVQNGFIVYDQDKRDVDDSVIEKQAILDAGPLCGKLILSNATDEEQKILENNREGDPAFISLGKRIVRLIYPPVSRLIQTLRINYGQYWLKDLEPWDSRRESIGFYCTNQLQLEWQSEAIREWHDFCPNKSETFITVQMRPDDFFKQYLLKEDYTKLSEVHSTSYSPNLSALCLARAHMNFDFGDFAYAFIEAATALELAMSDRIRTTYLASNTLNKALESYWNLPKRAQLVALASVIGDIPAEEIELSLSALEIRHNIVHEGYRLNEDSDTLKKFEALLKVTARLISGPPFKFPSIYSGNRLYS